MDICILDLYLDSKIGLGKNGKWISLSVILTDEKES